MTDNITPPVAEPVVTQPTPTVNTPVEVAPAPVEAAPAPVENTSVTESPVKAEPSTILGAEPVKEATKDEIKPADKEAKPTDKPEAKDATKEGEKPAEVKNEGEQSDEPAPLPTYEAFTLPEGLAFDDAKLKEFTKDIGEFQLRTKADQAEVQQFAQKLVDRHIAEVQDTVKRLNEAYANQWEKQKNDWKESFAKDPEIGGNRQDTTVRAAIEFINTHGGNEVQQKEFRDLMETTGIGNHPAMIRMLANAMTAYREGKPLPAVKPTPTATSKVSKRYGNI